MFSNHGNHLNVFKTKESENMIVFKKVVTCLTLPQPWGKLRQTREMIPHQYCLTLPHSHILGKKSSPSHVG